MRKDSARSEVSMQNPFHKAHSSNQIKWRSKLFKDANVMLGQLPFVGHNFCFKYTAGYVKGRWDSVDTPQ